MHLRLEAGGVFGAGMLGTHSRKELERAMNFSKLLKFNKYKSLVDVYAFVYWLFMNTPDRNEAD